MDSTLNLIASAIDHQSSETSCSNKIASALRVVIDRGQVTAGARLPSSRQLACRLGVSRATVHRSFEILVSQGYLQSVQGLATIVQSPFRGVRVSSPVSAQIDCSPPPVVSGRPSDSKNSKCDSVKIENSWLRPLRQLLQQHARGSDQFAPPQDALGYLPLRQAMSSYLARTRLVRSTEDSIAVIAAASTRLELIARMLINSGDVVALAERCDSKVIQILRMHGARLNFVAVDQDGMDIEKLIGHGHVPKLVYVTPSSHSTVLSLERRKQLIEWAKANRVLIVEDDQGAELLSGYDYLPAIQSFDDRDGVIYLASQSPLLEPVLKNVCLVMPDSFMGSFKQLTELFNSSGSLVEQMVLSDFVSSGGFENLATKKRSTTTFERALSNRNSGGSAERSSGCAPSHFISQQVGSVDKGARHV